MIVKSKIEIIISPNQCTCTCTYVLLADDCSPTGYTRLLENDSSHRDNFYVRSKMSYQRPPVRGGSQLLSYEKGDIFHVFDTLPTDHLGMWNVKKLNSRGEAIETGLIPVEVRCIIMLLLCVWCNPYLWWLCLFLVHLRQVKGRPHCHLGLQRITVSTPVCYNYGSETITGI